MAERIEGLSIGLGLDTIGIDSGLTEVKRKLSLVNSEMKANLSAFDKGERSVGKYETQITGLNKKLDVQKVSVRNAKNEYERMVEQHGEGSVQADKAARAYNNQVASLNNLENNVEKLTNELKEFEKQQEIAASGWTKMSDKMEKDGARLTSIGDGMKSVGKNMSMYITAPLVGFAGAAAKIGIDFDDSMAKVQAVSGATGGDLDQLRAKAEEMGATTKFSASEAAEGLNYMALAGWSTEEMLSGLDGVMALAAASGEDLGSVSDIVTDSLSAFQMQAEDSARFADVLAAASANANTDVSGLGAAFQYVAPVAGALSFTVEDTATAIGLMSNAGIKGEKAGTALRTMMTNLAKPTKAMQDEMDNLGISLTNTDGTMKTFDEIMNELRESFDGLDEAQQASAAATIFGKEAMSGALSIINTSKSDYDDLAGAINGSEGAAQEMADTMEGTLGGVIREIKSGIEGFAISVYEEMKPSLMEGAEAIKGVVGWLNNLSPEAKKAALMIGGIAAAIGPVLVVSGTLIAGLGGIMTALVPLTAAIGAAGGLTAAIGGMGGALLTFATGPVGLGIAAIAGLTVAGIAFVKHMSEDAIPEIDRFGDGVSETTKEALGSFFELSDGVGEAMSTLSLTSAEVTEEMANDIVGKFSSMNEQILEGMKTRQDEQLQTMQEFFAASSTLTQEEEDAILKRQQWSNDMQIEGQEAKEARIKEIMDAASKEKRELTENEKIEINGIQTAMNNEAVNVLSASEVEQKIIMERMKETAGALSAQQAAEVVKKASEQRDGAVTAAEEQYEGTVAEIIRMRDESGTISEEQATKLIAEARKTRDTTVGHAESMHQDIVSEAKAQAGEHVDQVDWSTGEILSKWEVYKAGVLERFRSTNKESMDDFKRWGKDFNEGSDRLRENILSGWTKYKNGVTTRFQDAGQSAINSLGKMVNGIIDGLNWVLTKLDMDKIAKWNIPNVQGRRSAGTTTGANVRAYAHGTKAHPGGLAMVGDGEGDNAGPELIRTPDGKYSLSPATNTILDLPSGTSVLSAKETRKFFEGVPQYANGVGDLLTHAWEGGKNLLSAGKNKAFDVFDYFTNPKKLFDIALSAIGFKMPSAGAMVGDALKGGFSMLKDKAVDYIKDNVLNFGFDGDGGGTSGFGPAFRKTSSYGFRIHPILKTAKMHNGDDYGAPVGTPIPARAGGRVTQAGYHNIRGNYVRINSGALERIYQHNQRNLVSAGQIVKPGQIIGTVGSTGRSTGPHLHYEVLRNGRNINPGGLATGGMTTGYTTSSLHEEGYPEFVIPTAPKRRTDAMKLLALAGRKIMGGGGQSNVLRPNQLPDVPGGGNNELLDVLKQQVALMQQMLANPQQMHVAMVTPNYDVLAEGVAEPVESINHDRNAMKDSGRKGRTY